MKLKIFGANLQDQSKGASELFLECQDCHAVGPQVRKDLCPSSLELSQEEVPVVICPECYHERVRDI